MKLHILFQTLSADKWKIELNDSKTEATIFTRRRPKILSNITINGSKIEWLDMVKYLGVTLDKKLTFANHINNLAQKAVTKLITLYHTDELR